MKKHWLILVLLFAVALWGCGGAPLAAAANEGNPTAMANHSKPQSAQDASEPVQGVAPVQMGESPPLTQIVKPPQPVTGTPREMPAPGRPPWINSTPAPTPTGWVSPFPQVGDEKLPHAPVQVQSVQVQRVDGKPWLVVTGLVPTPCHRARLRMSVQGRRIFLEMYAVQPNPDEACVEKMQPFEARVPLNNLTMAGRYTIWVQMASFDAP